MERISLSEHLFSNFPLKFMEPPLIFPGGSGINFKIDKAVTLLPLPDSPTIAKVSPFFKFNETLSTALLTPVGVENSVSIS